MFFAVFWTGVVLILCCLEVLPPSFRRGTEVGLAFIVVYARRILLKGVMGAAMYSSSFATKSLT